MNAFIRGASLIEKVAYERQRFSKQEQCSTDLWADDNCVSQEFFRMQQCPNDLQAKFACKSLNCFPQEFFRRQVSAKSIHFVGSSMPVQKQHSRFLKLISIKLSALHDVNVLFKLELSGSSPNRFMPSL